MLTKVLYRHLNFLGLLAALLLCGCAGLPGGADSARAERARAELRALEARYAPVSHLGIYDVKLVRVGGAWVLSGEVDQPEARAETLAALKRCGLSCEDRLQLLPDKALGDQTWGISCLSVASAREAPAHGAELGTQVLMGNVVRVLKAGTNHLWYYVQSSDGYPAWLEAGSFVRCARSEVARWESSPLLIVTDLEGAIFTAPDAGSEPVSDVVAADLIRQIGVEGDFFQVALPDGRSGFLARHAAREFAAWQRERRPTAENIEKTARRFLGRPYLWGGNSSKGLDCSGFTKLVFYLNGVDLHRNASHQARQGRTIALDREFSQLRKGDLLFFGRPARAGRPERIFHVGIYLGDRRFIHSSERVQINSLDPGSAIRDEHRIHTLLGARRVLPE